MCNSDLVFLMRNYIAKNVFPRENVKIEKYCPDLLFVYNVCLFC